MAALSKSAACACRPSLAVLLGLSDAACRQSLCGKCHFCSGFRHDSYAAIGSRPGEVGGHPIPLKPKAAGCNCLHTAPPSSPATPARPRQLLSEPHLLGCPAPSGLLGCTTVLQRPATAQTAASGSSGQASPALHQHKGHHLPPTWGITVNGSASPSGCFTVALSSDSSSKPACTSN